MPAPEAESLPVLDAAVRGPSGGNQQGWAWLVVTDPAIKGQVAHWYREGWSAAYCRRREEILAAPPAQDGLSKRSFLAARAFGSGTTLTTLYAGHEDDVRELLRLPGHALTMGLLPLGYPARGRWTQPKRRPVTEVMHWDRWGSSRSQAE